MGSDRPTHVGLRLWAIVFAALLERKQAAFDHRASVFVWKAKKRVAVVVDSDEVIFDLQKRVVTRKHQLF